MSMTVTYGVTMVGWVDVPYSDWGDFRRRRAVDISSLLDIPVGLYRHDHVRFSHQMTRDLRIPVVVVIVENNI